MRNVRHFVVFFSMAALLGLSGCGWLPPVDPADPSVAQSDMPRELQPRVSTADAATLAEGNATFAFELYAGAVGGDGNVFFSPFSLSTALAMTYAGARDVTATQMASALHFDLPQVQLHPAFNAVDLALASRNELAAPYSGQGVELTVANAIWGQRGFAFRDAFLDVLAANYGAGLRLADFSADPEAARAMINGWVERTTRNRIRDLLPQGSVSELTRLVLTNAIYFKAPWLHPFDADDTTTATFTTLSGAPVSVSMMRQTLTARYARVDRAQAVELPYNGGQVAMMLLVPDLGALPAFENTLDYAHYRAIADALGERHVHLGLPKFRFEHALSSVEALRALGMTAAFDPGAADFSGIDGTRELFITDILHKAFIAVDEKGTEAAAATAVVVGVTSAPTESVTLTIDRPFLIVIRDIPTDTILFLGRVTSPSA